MRNIDVFSAELRENVVTGRILARPARRAGETTRARPPRRAIVIAAFAAHPPSDRK